METMSRYHLLSDRTQGRVMIFDALTGAVQYPVCWQDIAAYYHYLVGRNRAPEAQGLLADAMAGSKPMTRMAESAARARMSEAGGHALSSFHL